MRRLSLLVPLFSLVALEANAARASSAAPASLAAPSLAAPTRAELEPSAYSITAPEGRDLRDSAHTLPAGRFAFRLGLLGSSVSDLYATLGLYAGVTKNWFIGTNLAHVGAGILNLDTRYRLYESEVFSVALGVRPSFINGEWMWLALRRQLASAVDVFVLPVQLNVTSSPVRWLQFDLVAEYNYSELFGHVSADWLQADAALVRRQFSLTPVVRFHVLDRTSFIAKVKLAPYTAIPVNASAEVEAASGVVVGGSVDTLIERPFDKTWELVLSARSGIGRGAFLEAGVSAGPNIELVYGSPVTPRLAFEVRF